MRRLIASLVFAFSGPGVAVVQATLPLEEPPVAADVARFFSAQGIVRCIDGDPISNAHITIHGSNSFSTFDYSAAIHELRTSADGSYKIDQPLRSFDHYVAVVEAADHMKDRYWFRPTGRQDLLLARSVSLRGNVVESESGRPLGRARVRVKHGGTWHSSHSDAGGRYWLPLPRGFSSSVSLRLEGVAPCWGDFFLDRDGQFDWVIPATHAVKGRVMDATSGEPISGATVRAHQMEWGPTNRNGEYEYRYVFPAESTSFTVDAQGYCPTSSRLSPTALARVPLIRSGSLRGNIVPIDENPFHPATIHYSLTWQSGPPWPKNDVHSFPYEGSVDTKEDGTFSFESIPLGAKTVTLTATSAERKFSRKVKGSLVGDPNGWVSLVPTEGGGGIRGRVTADGVPVPSVLTLKGPRFSHQHRVESDGSFVRKGLSPGKYEVTVHCLSLTMSCQAAPIATASIKVANDEVVAVDFSLESSVRRLQGRVTDTHGFPVGGVVTYLKLEDHPSAPLTVSVVADAKGRFEHEVPYYRTAAPEEWKLSWYHGPLQDHVMIGDEEEITIEVPQLGTLSLSVDDRETGQPLEAIEVLWGSDLENLRAYVDPLRAIDGPIATLPRNVSLPFPEGEKILEIGSMDPSYDRETVGPIQINAFQSQSLRASLRRNTAR